MIMRARVRKSSTPTPAVQVVPWAVRAVATLPKGARVSNPLLGEDPAGTVAVVDLAALLDTISKADGALLVLDEHVAVKVPGFTQFSLPDCPCTFAANYPLPDAPGLQRDVVAVTDMPEELALLTSDLEPVRLVQKSARVTKLESGEEERFILGVVLEPDTVDSQGDTISAEQIRLACHRYMENHANVGLQHQVFVNGKVKILENYLAPVDFTIGDQLIKAGTWLMAFRVLDDSIWAAVKEGLLNGLSIGGTGVKIPVA